MGRRRLAARNPEAFQPDLAMSLNNLSNQLSELGRHEALTAKREAEHLRSKARSATNSAADAVAPGGTPAG